MTNIARQERVRWVGASESAALLGVSPYLTRFELWHQKAGHIEAANLDGQERIEAGRHLEPAIAAWAAGKWSWPLRNVEAYLAHPSVEGMGCSLDFETLDGEPVEIKNVDRSVFLDGDWLAEGDLLLDAPAHFLIQLQHQLACRPGPARGWLVACVGGNRLYRMEVARHAGLIARIEREVVAFWRSIAAGEAPDPDFLADAAVIGQLYDGGSGEGVVDLRDDLRAHDLCAEYLAALADEKVARERKTRALAELKTKMQGSRVALAAGGMRVRASLVPAAEIHREAHWRFGVSRAKSSTTTKTTEAPPWAM